MIARVNTSTVGSAGSTGSQVTPATSLTAGNLAVVAIRTSHPSTISTVTDTAGNVYVLATSVTVADPDLYVYYAAGCRGNAANQVTVTLSAPITFWWVFTLQYSGIATAGALDVAVVGRDVPAVTNIAKGPFATTDAGELVLMVASDNTLSTFTAGTDFTLVSGVIGDPTPESYGGIEEYVAPLLVGYTAHITSSVSGGLFNDSCIVVSFRSATATVLGPPPELGTLS